LPATNTKRLRKGIPSNEAIEFRYDLSRNRYRAVDLRPRGLHDPTLERPDEFPRSLNREVGTQGGFIGPLFEEKQAKRILAVDMHRMRDAARLLPRALDMLETEVEDVIEGVLSRQNAAGYQNHFDYPNLIAPIVRAPGCCSECDSKRCWMDWRTRWRQ
jgi:hypothetical protein